MKAFDELTRDELYDIYKLRAAVFVVEQKGIYQDVDDADKKSYHVFYRNDEGLQAYLRVIESGIVSENVSIGRLIAVKKKMWYREPYFG